ncbi:MAG: hypothetical protein OEU76_08495 [Cyclobacteriaceae bacterium]|nr:hypothetical protein [Cyclobacteriaceae bacterium]
MFRIWFVFLPFLLSLSTFSLAQKIKYKDVYGLLGTRQYEAAEPFLKKYVQENDDNPNAFLFMGIIYQENSMKDDVLKNSQEALNHMDSAIYFYDKAFKTIDEKELKRNKDYYEMYNSRDLRSGVYGVKLSNVQFEIEKSIDAMRERIDKVKMVNHYFTEAQRLYKKSNELFLSIQSSFPGMRELYLRAGDSTLKDMTTLSARFDSCSKAFEHYKVSLSNIPKSGYDQKWNLVKISDFRKDGVEVADFYEPNLQIWDYKSFATEVVGAISNELGPIREKLVKYDVEINKLRERLASDSISVKTDLTLLDDKLLREKLKKYDDNPLPLNVLALKVSKLEYLSTIVENRKLKDSVDVFFRLSLVKNEIRYLKKVDSLANGLMARDIEDEALNYEYFVANTYNSAGLLRGYVKTENDFAARELVRKNKQLDLRTKALQWLDVENDSVPIELSYQDSKFKPLFLLEKKYTSGIYFPDSGMAKGYLYSITPSRRPDIAVQFPIDEVTFNYANLSNLKAIVTVDQSDNIHFVLLYSTINVDGKYPVTVSKIYRSDGLSWCYNLILDFLPTQIEYLQDANDLLIKSESELIMLLDKGGKVKL